MSKRISEDSPLPMLEGDPRRIALLLAPYLLSAAILVFSGVSLSTVHGENGWACLIAAAGIALIGASLSQMRALAMCTIIPVADQGVAVFDGNRELYMNVDLHNVAAITLFSRFRVTVAKFYDTDGRRVAAPAILMAANPFALADMVTLSRAGEEGLDELGELGVQQREEGLADRFLRRCIATPVGGPCMVAAGVLVVASVFYAI